MENKTRTQARRSDGVLVLVGENTLSPEGQAREIQCAKEVDTPILGIQAYRENRTTIY
ncbi:hypothetical protein [Brevibacterium aurantiacum]|uniref:hypothetical protein n=1 Tax=Brevibacterium aurantiacum TaxID=273384 RepID=UPI001C904E49|nr:hypothetical protein [Brevibacterium aurantiacum]